MSDTYDSPGTDELFQPDEPEGPVVPVTVPVAVEGPVRTEQPGVRSGGAYTVEVGTAPYRVLPNDPRRKAATLVPLDTDLYLGNIAADVRADAGAPAQWPQNVPLVLESSDEWWIAAPSSCTVTVIVEQWAR